MGRPARCWCRPSVNREDPQRPRFFLTIEDDGPGLPEAVRAEMLKRGRRLDETKPGSGLGLSIVSDLAALYRRHAQPRRVAPWVV